MDVWMVMEDDFECRAIISVHATEAAAIAEKVRLMQNGERSADAFSVAGPYEVTQSRPDALG